VYKRQVVYVRAEEACITLSFNALRIMLGFVKQILDLCVKGIEYSNRMTEY